MAAQIYKQELRDFMNRIKSKRMYHYRLRDKGHNTYVQKKKEMMMIFPIFRGTTLGPNIKKNVLESLSKD